MKFLKLFEEFVSQGPTTAKVSGQEIIVTIPITTEEKMKGYQNTTGPTWGEGMLFISPYEEIQSFHMKNVPIPLDILFFNKDRELVDSKTMEPYSTDEEVIYYSDRPSKYALELPHGWIERYLDVQNSKLIL
jgi:uncharacterized membrane protein (UPF0127 family)